jgi:hypothetical protein
MRRILTTTAVLAALAPGLAGAQAGPALQVLGTAPMTVRGTAFRPGEHVTLTLIIRRVARVRSTTSSASGRFVVVFTRVRIAQCSVYVVRARGDEGSRAALRFLPECPPP